MTTFDDRNKTFEKKYAHDEETAFKVNARRNKLLGQWVAELLGYQGQQAEEYAKAVVLSDFEKPGDDDVVEKVLRDLSDAGITKTADEIRSKMAALTPIARQQVTGE